MGSVYQRGKTYWIKYYRNGKCHRESSGSSKKMVAQKLLARREGDIAKGKIPGIQFNKVTFEQLAADFINDYKINQRKSLARAERSTNHLRRYFGDFNAPQITTPKINEYIIKRSEEGASNASINRELAALRRMLRMGKNQTPPIVNHVPDIPILKENNVRKGFFEHSQYMAVHENLPEYLKGFVTFAYTIGWRFNEITGLTWNQVDLEREIVRLEVGETKNDDGRAISLDEELLKVFRHQWELRKNREILTPYVFPNYNSTGRIKDIRGSWNKACKLAGIGKRLFHDFRRTAVRNMIRAGIPEQLAMKISGHKTRSVFARYNIINEDDLKWAAQKQAEYINSLMGTNSGTIANFPTKKGSAKTG